MDWQQIMEQILEINDLQQEVLLKSNNSVIRKIVERHNKYGNDTNFDKRTLNNAILEHQIDITLYQVVILKKINELKLDTSHHSIYINMPETEIEAEKYVTELKKKYELANKCFDLVIDIETLSNIEYESNSKFEDTEYASKIRFENDLFQNYILNIISIGKENIKSKIISKQQEFLNSLSLDQKKNLFLQLFTLSYDKNSFEYFNQDNLIIKIGKERNYNLPQIAALSSSYQDYRKLLTVLENERIEKQPLENTYDEFKIIYETEFFKQKVNKK